MLTNDNMLIDRINAKPITVSEINNQAKSFIEKNFAAVYVTGEISNCMRPRSGHYYFSLKDEKSQLSCALFLGYQGSLNSELKDGMMVNVRGKLSIYPGRGNYQMIITHLEPAGDGKLKLAFEQLKAKLNNEGLFAEELKKQIPSYPKKIGVVSSATGAALRDVLKVLRHRYPIAEIILYPSLVQGDMAKEQICRALAKANQRQECDLIILCRGGGSIEDLWPFNEEVVARAIFKSELAVITGIGHEIDFTIADFVADKRAATPSQAAQFATPELTEIQQQLSEIKKQIIRAMSQKISTCKLTLAAISKQLKHPSEKIATWSQQLDNLEQQLNHNWYKIFNSKVNILKQLMTKIETLSPMQTLKRGYSVSCSNDQVITSVTQVDVDSTLDIMFSDGALRAKVIEISQKREK